jgi:hypothetical protein
VLCFEKNIQPFQSKLGTVMDIKRDIIKMSAFITPAVDAATFKPSDIRSVPFLYFVTVFNLVYKVTTRLSEKTGLSVVNCSGFRRHEKQLKRNDVNVINYPL